MFRRERALRQSDRLSYLSFVFLTAMLCLALLSAGCGEVRKEVKQRGIFIQLLKRNILSKKGIRFPLLTPEEKSAIGPYADQYDLLNILNEDKGLLLALSELPALQKQLATTIDPVEKKQLIIKAEESMRSIQTRLLAVFQKAKNDRAALKQTDDLKVVYDEAFTKVVRTPAGMLVDIIEKSLEASERAQALNDYILANPDTAQYSGSKVLVRKAEAETYVRSLLEAYRATSAQALESLRALNSLTW